MNLSNRKLCDADYILLGKGLSFVPKLKSHDKVKLAEETFRFSRRLRLKEYFFDESSKTDSQFKEKPFFNKKSSTFIPRQGRDEYLDFYIEAIHQEILQSSNASKYTNISEEELSSLRSLANDNSIVIKKADKSANIVIMSAAEYEKEVLRHVDNDRYYGKLDTDISKDVVNNIREGIENISETEEFLQEEFDIFPEKIRTPQFYILPKIHKCKDSSLPLEYPGRPIVSAVTHPLTTYLNL